MESKYTIITYWKSRCKGYYCNYQVAVKEFWKLLADVFDINRMIRLKFFASRSLSMYRLAYFKQKLRLIKISRLYLHMYSEREVRSNYSFFDVNYKWSFVRKSTGMMVNKTFSNTRENGDYGEYFVHTDGLGLYNTYSSLIQSISVCRGVPMTRGGGNFWWGGAS